MRDLRGWCIPLFAFAIVMFLMPPVRFSYNLAGVIITGIGIFILTGKVDEEED